MRFLQFLGLGLTVLVLSGCIPSMFGKSKNAITDIIVMKEKRQLYLMHDKRVVKRYKIDLGFAPRGHKVIEGDGKTPEGHYVINRNNPQSRFHLSLGMSYPNNKDRSRAYALGKSPGGDIYIHGQPNNRTPKGDDWTHGCIAVQNVEIEYMFANVETGTPIHIYP
ncbi:MAG: L,D-transpeptidase family protein [Paracoccaceae bacterium]|jgi:murein L,D-transpeptidase YafK|nr:L,D-transpeptidase family protein [Paracoccaceae bacterium]